MTGTGNQCFNSAREAVFEISMIYLWNSWRKLDQRNIRTAEFIPDIFLLSVKIEEETTLKS